MSVVSQDVDDAQTIQEMKAMMKAQMEEIESVRAQIAKIESKVRKQKRNSNDVESGDKITEELSDDDVKQLLFEGSTHQFLFLDRIQNPVQLPRLNLCDQPCQTGHQGKPCQPGWIIGSCKNRRQIG